MRHHSPQPCTACRAVTTIPEAMVPGGLIVCTCCGHVMIALLTDRWILDDLTRDEAAAAAQHANFPAIRAAQRKVTAGMWG